MKKITLLALIFLLSLSLMSPAAEYVWTDKADMPAPRWNYATCEIDGKIYALGVIPTGI